VSDPLNNVAKSFRELSKNVVTNIVDDFNPYIIHLVENYFDFGDKFRDISYVKDKGS
jgi:hypothetical protein